MEKNAVKPMTYSQKHAQCKKEAKATLIFYAFCFFWWVMTGWVLGLSGAEIYIWYIPLWFWLSVIALVPIGCVGCVILIKKYYVNFDLGEDAGERIESVVSIDDIEDDAGEETP